MNCQSPIPMNCQSFKIDHTIAYPLTTHNSLTIKILLWFKVPTWRILTWKLWELHFVRLPGRSFALFTDSLILTWRSGLSGGTSFSSEFGETPVNLDCKDSRISFTVCHWSATKEKRQLHVLAYLMFLHSNASNRLLMTPNAPSIPMPHLSEHDGSPHNISRSPRPWIWYQMIT